MSCARARRLLDAWVDDELDPSTHAEIDAHLAQCPACTALWHERAELREAVKAADLRMAAPPSLAADVRRALRTTSFHAPAPRSVASWWMPAATGGIGALAGALAVYLWVSHAPQEIPSGEAITRHVAALVMAEGRAERLVQISAADHHVVKPWFQGKVDFSPPVPDLASEGFTLLGGRLDRVDGRVAAVIVYRIRNHPVELFVWRSQDSPTSLRVAMDRGFGVASWTDQGLALAAVSDVESRDLERFARAMQADRAGYR